MKDFDGSVIIISHDRYFLDAVTNRTMELYCNHLIMYKGNYSAFMDKKEKDQESIRNKYENDLKEIKRLEGIIQQQIEWSQERNYITAASKQKEIDRIKAQLVPPEEENHDLRFKFHVNEESGNDVVMCKDLENLLAIIIFSVTFHSISEKVKRLLLWVATVLAKQLYLKCYWAKKCLIVVILTMVQV